MNISYMKAGKCIYNSSVYVCKILVLGCFLAKKTVPFCLKRILFKLRSNLKQNENQRKSKSIFFLLINFVTFILFCTYVRDYW